MSKLLKPKGKGADLQGSNDGLSQDVSFKFNASIIYNNLPDVAIIFQWMDPTTATLRSTFNTDLSKDWQKPSNTDGKTLNFTREYAPVIVNETFAKNLCADKFYIMFVSKTEQTVLEKMELHYSSLLFSNSNETKFEHSTTMTRVPGLESFSLTITANKPLLTPLLRENLNPFQICIKTAKNLPNHSDKSAEYKPTYVLCNFLDDTVIRTHSLPLSSKCKWEYKQVILLGLISPTRLKEFIQTSSLEFQVHDRDEIIKEKPPKKDPQVLVDIKYEGLEEAAEAQENAQTKKDKNKKGGAAQKNEKPASPQRAEKTEKKPKVESKSKNAKDMKAADLVFVEDQRRVKTNSYGIANFLLNQFLETDTVSLKLTRPIAPVKKYEAEKKKKKNSDSEDESDPHRSPGRTKQQPNYLEHVYSYKSLTLTFFKESSLIVTFDLSFPITAINPLKSPKIKVKAITNKDSVVQSPEQLKTNNDNQTKTNQLTGKEASVKQGAKELRYERAVVIFSVESVDLRNQFLSEIRTINLKAFNEDSNNVPFLVFKALTEEEKKNLDLDIITGFEFIDSEFHTFIVEGLAEHSMKNLGKLLPVYHPESTELRMLKNSEFRFEKRLYLDFNVDVKKVWLIKNLAEIMCQPEIYMRNKVPENVFQTLRAMNELRKCYNFKTVYSSNLFPLPKDIVETAQIYGDISAYEDFRGNKSLPFQTINLKSSTLRASQVGLLKYKSVEDLDEEQEEEYFQLKYGSPDSLVSSPARIVNKQQERQSVNSISSNIQRMIRGSKFELYTLHRKNPYPDVQDEVYVQGQQKLNIYEKQKEDLKSIVRNDPKNFYTYSPDYMSASIDPFNVTEVVHSEQKKLKEQWKTPDGFKGQIPKTKEDYVSHPMKPSPEKIRDMSDYPWYVEKEDQDNRIKEKRAPTYRWKGLKDFDNSPKVKTSLPPLNENSMSPQRKSDMQSTRKKSRESSRGTITSNSPLTKILRSEGEVSKARKVGKDTQNKSTTESSYKELSNGGRTSTVPEDIKGRVSIFLEDKFKDFHYEGAVDRKFKPEKAIANTNFLSLVQNPHQNTPIYKRKAKITAAR